MTILKCKMCGGDIQKSEDQYHGTCDSCGSTMTFPRVSDEQRANLFNRANHFRRQGEFDKAIAAYESILNQDDADAEAHWGVVLSRYGIEYVEDPVSQERVPTCQRVQLSSILMDADYLSALEHAPDSYSRGLYEEEARRIADIQKGILALSALEKPYDVFICYKETTDAGSRTPDSALAQDIYFQLNQAGYRVFFSRISLEDKLGQQYEPYIFAALNSARVMVVIGTKAEYFNAVWVKNEWSRFLALMKKDRDRLLIPCYRGMDPYDLPEALSMLQSQDMGKIGFLQDLVRGIKKVLDVDKAQTEAASAPKVTESIAAPGVQSLLVRAQLFLEDGDFKAAAEYADRVLDIDPKCAPAYMVKLQATLGVNTEDELAAWKEPLEPNADYQKALRFADEKQRAVYLGYDQKILDRIEAERDEDIYQQAIQVFETAKEEPDFVIAQNLFDSISGYKDAMERAQNSQSQAEAARLAAEEMTRQVEKERVAYEHRQINKRRLTIIVSLLVLLALALVNQAVIPKSNYQKAMDMLAAEKYDQAAQAFATLGGYQDSATMVKECAYQKGKDMLVKKQYDQAAKVFASLGAYKDSAALVNKCTSQKGK